MEENKKSYNKLPLILTIVTCLVCCTVFTVLCGIGLIPIPTGNGKFYDIDTASAVKKSYQVEDEATLRKLLLLNEELDIVVARDIEIRDTLLVNGRKTLYGDATIAADIAGEFKTMYMMDVQVGAILTLDGPTLDSDGSCDGINVGQKAELYIKSGTIQYMRNAVNANGIVTMTGGLIQHVSQNGIIASFRSKVYINGGVLYNGGNMLLNITANGYAEINEGATFKASRSTAIYNVGELNVYGGTICDTNSYGINTEGKLHMEYKGDKKDGYIEMNNIGTIAVRMTSGADCYISDVHAVNVGTNGVYTTDLRSNGKTTIENCILDTCAIVEGTAISVSRKVKIKNVEILNSQGGGINCRTYCDVKVDGLVIDGVKSTGIAINDDFEGANITLSNVEQYNVAIKGEAEASFTDCVFGKSKKTNVVCTKNTTLNLVNVQVEGASEEGVIAVQCSAGSTLNMLGNDNVISGSTRTGVCLLEGATLNMEGGKIIDNHGDVTGAAVWLRKEGATFNMHGGTISNNSTDTSSGAVFVADKTTFNMYGGTITGNKAELTGGAVGVQGMMNMSGGTISNNETKTAGGGIVLGNNTKKQIFGKLNMTGGVIEKNKAGTNGGGISVSGKTTANISGGIIRNNEAEGIGNGIADNGNLTISKNAFVTGNDVGLISRDIIVKIVGNSLRKHSVAKPLLITPHFKTEPKEYAVVECDNETAVATMVGKTVKSGRDVYTLLQSENKKNQIVVGVNEIVMNLDTTGAETVYVSSFEQLKEAVQTTKTKRNIVICDDIVMESLITVPAGTIVNIRDDGQKRTLSRNEKHSTVFFETWYGTGLVLEGTSEGKLVLEGKTFGEVVAQNVNVLVRVRGTSEFTNVAFKDNGNTTVTMSGAFIRNEYGYATVAGCSFTNGTAKYGGAIYSCGDKLTVTDSVFTNNTATERGGAISCTKTSTVIENTTFKDNVAAGSGGAIHSASNAKLTLKRTTSDAIFEGNMVLASLTEDNYGGGAVCVASGDATISGYTFKDNTATNSNGGAVQLNSSSVVANISDCTFTGNKTVDTDSTDKITYGGGAILSKSKTTITDTTFVENTASDLGGAICMAYGELELEKCTFDANTATEGGAIQTAKKDIVTTIGNSVFTNNTSTSYGGAICNYGTKGLTLTDCAFGGEGTEEDQYALGNKAGANGGAIYHANGGKITLKDNNVDTQAIFKNNKSGANGGAICIGSGTIEVTGYEFVGNYAYRGGAVRLNSTGIEAAFDGSVFKMNIAPKNGGAISNASTKVFEGDDKAAVTISNCVFGAMNEGNSSDDRGGAIYNVGTSTKVSNTTFANNTAVYGGAINNESSKLTVTSCQFTGSMSQNAKTDGKTGKGGGAVNIVANSEAIFEGKGTFTSNSTNEWGGAIYMTDSKLRISGYTFDQNSAKYAGAVFVDKEFENKDGETGETSEVKIDDSVFTRNTSSSTGGVSYVNGRTVTFTDCKFGGTDDQGNSLGNISNQHGGVLGINNGAQIKFDGKNVEKAVVEGNTASEHGGAIYVRNGRLNVSGYQFVNNSSNTTGGAIYIDAKNNEVSVSGSTFTNNQAAEYGGAIHNAGTSIQLTDTRFTGNTAVYGGAINNTGSKLTVTSCHFTGNASQNAQTNGKTGKGGGAVNIVANSEATFDGEGTFTSNSTNEWGGAIYMTDSKLRINGYTFDQNSANYGGAILIDNVYEDRDGETGELSEVAISSSAFTNNSSTKSGGAIFVKRNLAVTQTVFDDNSAENGGAAYITGGIQVSLSASTFTKNQATTYGGAIYNASTTATAGKYGLSITACTFGGEGTDSDKYVLGNKANQGGAIYCTNIGNMSATDCNFIYNQARQYGGALCIANKGSVTFNGGSFIGNAATSSGGAVYVKGKDSNNKVFLTITGMAFTGNTTTAGAIRNAQHATITLNSCTSITQSDIYSKGTGSTTTINP